MAGNKLFKPRHPKTVPYILEESTDDKRLYDEVTDFVQTRLAEIKGDGSKNAAGFALTTMQRRLASSARAIRRTLERRLERGQARESGSRRPRPAWITQPLPRSASPRLALRPMRCGPVIPNRSPDARISATVAA